MTNAELAQICLMTPGCYKCKPEVKRECLGNECWRSKNVKDRNVPCVYYGLLKGGRNEADKS